MSVPKCKTHPQYEAKKDPKYADWREWPPSICCVHCWRIYFDKHRPVAAVSSSELKGIINALLAHASIQDNYSKKADELLNKWMDAFHTRPGLQTLPTEDLVNDTREHLANKKGVQKMNDKKVLNERELARLLKVPTSTRQARQIINRNKAALELLKNGRSGRINVRCPHCLVGEGNIDPCKNCAYPFEPGSGGYDAGCQCCEYEFGGHKYESSIVMSMITLKPEYISVENPNFNTSSQRTKAVKAATSWLKGHIEWGEEVIRLNKAKKPQKKRKKTRRKASR